MRSSGDTMAPITARTGRNFGRVSEIVAYWVQPVTTRAMGKRQARPDSFKGIDESNQFQRQERKPP
jgi:hypothetical protein